MKIITNALSARRPDWKRKRDGKGHAAAEARRPEPGPSGVDRKDIRHIWHGWGAEFEPLERLEEVLRSLGPRPEVDQIRRYSRKTIAHARSPGAP